MKAVTSLRTERENSETWPPAPLVMQTVPEHDILLANLVQELTAARLPVTKILLIKGLRERTGLSLRDCLPVVQDYIVRQCPDLIRRDQRWSWLAAFSVVCYVLGAVAILSSGPYLKAKFKHMPNAQRIAWHNNSQLLANLLLEIAVVPGLLLVACLIVRRSIKLRNFKW